MDDEKRKICEDYINRLYLPIFLPFKLMGFGRFDIAGGRIVEKSLSSVIISLLVLAVVNSCALYIFYRLAIQQEYLMVTEVIIVSLFVILQNLVLYNISFVNKRGAALLLNDFVEIDYFFGDKETVFMRDVADNTYYFLSLLSSLTLCIALLILFATFMGDIYIYIAGIILFSLLYFIYYDFAFFISLYTAITLKVRYMNVAILKLAQVKLEYIPHQYPFNSIFWNTKYDDMVDFHKKAKLEDFSKAFVMIFHQLRYLENCYRFLIFAFLCNLTVGTFVVVQNMILYSRTDGNVDMMRVAVLTGWCIQSWLFQIGVSQQTDMFHRQIRQTNLICTYIQLTPTYSDEIYKLTEDILRTLEMRDSRMSIYGIFYFNTSLILRITSSIFVYITMQLQLATAKNLVSDVVVINNATGY